MKTEALMKIINELNKWLIIAVAVIVVLILFILVSFSVLSGYKIIKTCSSFSTQKDAQKALKRYPHLDKDHDGIACNQLLR